MTKYTVLAKINSTIPFDTLCCSLRIHHDNGLNQFDVLPITDITALSEDYLTPVFKTIDLPYDYQKAIYILSVMFYRKLTNGHLVLLTKSPIITTCFFSENDSLNNEIEVNFGYKESRASITAMQSNILNTINLSIPIEPTFFMVDQSLKDLGNPFDTCNVSKNLNDRMQKKDSLFDSPLYPSSGNAFHLTGAGAFFYCLLNDRPDLYKQTVKGLFEQGSVKLGLLDIKANTDTRKPQSYFYSEKDFGRNEQFKRDQLLNKPKVPPIDWISLSSLYDSIIQDETRTIPPIVSESQMQICFNSVGSVKLLAYEQNKKLTLDDFFEINQFVYHHHHALALINPKILNDLSNDSQYPVWVVWAGALHLSSGLGINRETDLSAEVELVLYSQGTVGQRLIKGLTINKLIQNIYTVVLFSKIP